MEAGKSGHAQGGGEVRVGFGPEGGHDPTFVVPMLGACRVLPVSGSRDARIAAIAAVQRGRVAGWQLLAAGVSRSAIDRLVKRGALIVEHRGVFAVGHTAAIEYAAETAALLAVRAGAALSHHSAARCLNLRAVSDGLIHVTVAGGPVQAPAGVRVHRSSILTVRDLGVSDGLPVTAPAWTLLDLATSQTRRQVELAFDQAIVNRIMTLSDVSELLARIKRRPGAPLLRALFDREQGHGMTLTRSQAEERCLRLIRDAGLPAPQLNARVHGYEVDFYWPQHHLVVEIDGFRYHSTARAFEHDRHKQNDLQTHGIDTLRFTWQDLTDRQLMTAATLAQQLSR